MQDCPTRPLRLEPIRLTPLFRYLPLSNERYRGAAMAPSMPTGIAYLACFRKAHNHLSDPVPCLGGMHYEFYSITWNFPGNESGRNRSYCFSLALATPPPPAVYLFH